MKKRFALLLAVALALVPALPAGAETPSAATEKTPAVTVRTELDTYSTKTSRILTYWENNSAFTLDFAEHWMLEREVDGEWVEMEFKTITDTEHYALLMAPGSTRKHVHNLNNLAENLRTGRYRLNVYYTYVRAPGDYTDYVLRDTFRVVSDSTYTGVSELDAKGLSDYEEITSDELLQSCSAHIYRHPKTFASVLVYGGRQTPLGGTGGRGVRAARYFAADDQEYLVYSYSVGDRPVEAYVAVLNLATCEVVYTSPSISDLDLWLNPVYDEATYEIIPNQFRVSGNVIPDTDGDAPDISMVIGTLQYDAGTFTLEETPQ